MPPRINIPPVTRVLLIALVSQSLLSAAIRYRQWSETSAIVIPYLTLIPQLSLAYPWTFLTSTLVEGNLFTLAIACLTLYQGGRYLERAWSSADLAKFLVIVSLVPNFLTFVVMLFFFALTRNERWTLSPIAGTIPLQISFLVAISQLVPAHTVTVFRGVVSLRVMRIPLLYIGLVTILGLTPLLSRAAVWQAIFGFLASWTYLRFYKTVFPDLDASQPTSLRGDAAETFAFAQFFPAPVRPAVAAGAAQVFDVLVAVRLCTPFSAADVSAARGDHNMMQRRGGGGAPGGARAEAERRRAIALRALDQRLNAAAAAKQPQPQPPQPASQTAGPTVQTQPQTSTQAAMTTEPGQMLGDSKFEPDSDGSKS